MNLKYLNVRKSHSHCTAMPSPTFLAVVALQKTVHLNKLKNNGQYL
jgi:hypothetical protein